MRIHLSKQENDFFDRLEDEQSKKVFLTRKDYAENSNSSVFNDVLYHPDGYDEIISKLKGYKFVIYGAGLICERLINRLAHEEVIVNCVEIWDKNTVKHNTQMYSINITPPPEEFSNQCDYVLIALSEYKNSKLIEKIEDFLISIGIQREKIIRAYWKLLPALHQYFDREIILSSLENSEIFVDGGCFDCFDSIIFRKYCEEYGKKMEKSYAFEANVRSYNSSLNLLSEQNRTESIFLINAALWHEDGELTFYDIDDEPRASSIVEGKGSPMTVRSVALDKFIQSDEKVTFIKLDIEGAELEALQGAKIIISQSKPKLAICIYHKPNDYIDLMKYIISIRNDYKFYMRHYSGRTLEVGTVLYCV